jgi:hypothetical protein
VDYTGSLKPSMSKPRLLFFGHSHNLQTGSTVFLLDLLQAHFEVTALWDRSWLDPADTIGADAINAANPEYVLFFMQMLPRRELRRLRCTNLTWIVMQDNIHYRSSRYRKYAAGNLKVIHFSDATYAFFTSLGFESLKTRYFPAPRPAVQTPEPRLFFWIRRDEEVSWSTVKSLLGDWRPAKIVMRLSADPGYRAARPPEEDIGAYRIEIHEGWLEPAQYLALKAACSLFVAPRKSEGIGMAMLEAMSQGMAVLAPDAPVMNEYIRHGQTGYLFDPQRPAPIPLDAWRTVGANARRSIATGHAAWQREQPGIVDFIRTPPERVASLTWRLSRRLGF